MFGVKVSFVMLSIVVVVLMTTCHDEAEGAIATKYERSIHVEVDSGDSVLPRSKRQAELLDLEDAAAAAAAQKSGDDNLSGGGEDESFWSRIARVAINLLRKFMTWLSE